MLRLTDRLSRDLLALPESGMGYQLVAATTKDDATKRAVVYNAELLVFDDEPRTGFSLKSHTVLLREARSSEGEIKAVRMVARYVAPLAVHERTAAKSKPSGPAAEAPVEATKSGEVFKRFSAYEDDRRVLPDKSLRPGTYGTTEADAKNVHTGAEAVARYALPDPKPASYVVTVRPHAPTPIQSGTVAPAYGQPGGGVEVIFPNGTQPATVSAPTKLPDQ
jgi:hypothetical protein